MSTWGGRVGPYPSIRTGNPVSEADLRALGDNLAMVARGTLQVLLAGARGVLIDGEAFAGGVTLPAGAAIISADGYPVYRVWQAKQITFEAASGNLALYLCASARTDADAQGAAPMLAYELDAVTVLARPAAQVAPSWALKLGEGSVAASSFTTFVEADGLRIVVPAHGEQHAADGADPVTAAMVGALAVSTRGAANGVASLGSDGKVPADQLPTGSGGVASFNGRTGAVTPQASDYTPALIGALATSARGAANGVASLGSDGKVPTAQLPSLTVSSRTRTRVDSYFAEMAGMAWYDYGAPGQVYGTGGVLEVVYDAVRERTYYDWVYSGSSAEVNGVLTVRLPQNFSDWDDTAAIVANVWTSDGTLGKAKLTIKKPFTSGTYSTGDLFGNQNFTEHAITRTDLSAIGLSAGNEMQIHVKLTAGSSKRVRLAEIRLTYLETY